MFLISKSAPLGGRSNDNNNALLLTHLSGVYTHHSRMSTVNFYCYNREMNNLVLAVSLDSSLELLSHYADIIVLDKGGQLPADQVYETVYIRSHFSHPDLLPQVFEKEINDIIKRVRGANPNVRFIDGMDTIKKIVSFEDKWGQYKLFSNYMPRTELHTNSVDTSSFVRPVYKKRLSSRGSGVTWEKERVSDEPNGWIIQESIDIKEELRIYVVAGNVYSVGAVKQSMTEGNKAQGVSSRELAADEIEFIQKLMEAAPELEVAGIDVARTVEGGLKLMEVNRSPGFAKFNELTGANLADIIYAADA